MPPLYMKGETKMYNDHSAARMRTRNLACANVNACANVGAKAPAASPSPTCRATWGLTGYPLASVYAPLQNFTELYDIDTALTRGTVFSELDLPFVCGEQKGGCCRG